MTRRIKYTASIKIRICEEYLSGTIRMKELCQKYNIPYSEKGMEAFVSYSQVYSWVKKYAADGY